MVYLEIKGAVIILLGSINQIEQKRGRGNHQKVSVTFFNANMYILSNSKSLQPPLGPKAFKIPNNMVHVSNLNYRFNVKLAEKIHPI